MQISQAKKGVAADDRPRVGGQGCGGRALRDGRRQDFAQKAGGYLS